MYIRVKHRCPIPPGDPGDVWRCDDCGKLYICGRPDEWHNAGPIVRWRLRKELAGESSDE
ncbi:MAG: hypothetical protein ACRDP6_47345 [Actinoallomurus sp.]